MDRVRPKLIIVVVWQGWLLRTLNPLLLRVGVMLTSRNHPVGNFSRVPVEGYYRSLERLNEFVLQLPCARTFPRSCCLNRLDEEARIRLQRQLVLRAFTEEWTFSSMVASAYPQIRRCDLTITNARFRLRRIRAVARWRGFRTLSWVAKNIVKTLVGPRQCNEKPIKKPITMVWGSVPLVEWMDGDPRRVSLPRFLSEVAGHLGLDPDEIWVGEYGRLTHCSGRSRAPLKIAPREAVRVFVEAAGAFVRVLLGFGSRDGSVLAMAESARYSWSACWIRRIRPRCVTGTVSDVSCDPPLVVAGRMHHIPACWIAYASLNVPSAAGPVWDDLEPGYRYLLYSHYVVWGESIARLFRRYAAQGAEVLVSGPMIFAPDGGAERTHRQNGMLRIGIFDIPPPPSELVASIGIGRSWSTLEASEAFYADILDAVRELPMAAELVIKPKRMQTSSIVMRGYAELLQRVQERASVRVHLCDAGENPWTVMANVDAMISMPFTSPTSMGVALGLPSIFYASSTDVRPGRHTLDGDRLVTGREALTAWLRRACADQGRSRQAYSGTRQLARVLAGVIGLTADGPTSS